MTTPPAAGDWYSNFTMSDFTFINTSGGGTDANGTRIRATNTITYLVYASPLRPRGSYSLKIRVTGKKDFYVKAASANINIDRVLVLRDRASFSTRFFCESRLDRAIEALGFRGDPGSRRAKMAGCGGDGTRAMHRIFCISFVGVAAAAPLFSPRVVARLAIA